MSGVSTTNAPVKFFFLSHLRMYLLLCRSKLVNIYSKSWTRQFDGCQIELISRERGGKKCWIQFAELVVLEMINWKKNNNHFDRIILMDSNEFDEWWWWWWLFLAKNRFLLIQLEFIYLWNFPNSLTRHTEICGVSYATNAIKSKIYWNLWHLKKNRWKVVHRTDLMKIIIWTIFPEYF